MGSIPVRVIYSVHYVRDGMVHGHAWTVKYVQNVSAADEVLCDAGFLALMRRCQYCRVEQRQLARLITWRS